MLNALALIAPTLIAPALAVPKVYSDTVVVLAIAPDGHRVLLGTLGSFDDSPHRFVDRDVATGEMRSVAPEVEAAFATCIVDTPCPALDSAWIAGAWIAWSDPSVPATWIVTALAAEGWTTNLNSSCANEGTIFTPCQAHRGLDTIDLRVRDGEIRVTLNAKQQVHEVALSRERLAQLGVSGSPWSGLVVWGSDGVLVALPGEWANEGEALPPPLIFVPQIK